MSKSLFTRILPIPKTSFFLLGMRGSGKSTWVRTLNLSPYVVDLLREDLYQNILANPEIFSASLAKLKPGAWVFVDEVQRIPSLLNEVHRFIEEKQLRFILTGSSARKLRRAGVNLLGGRALVKNMFPLLPEEMGDRFDLIRTLEEGSLPLILSFKESRSEHLQSYVQTYLKQEIQAEALARNLPGFLRFLPVAALFHGQVINVSSLSRDVGVERTTVAGYLDILEDTLLTFRLPAFEAKLRVRERKHPKLYWLDSGVVRAAKGQLGKLAEEEKGAVFEGWVAQLLRAYQSYRHLFDDMYYWAPVQSKKVEVDFLLVRGKELCAVEVKATARLKNEALVGLRAVSNLRGLKKKYLVYLGRESLQVDGIDVLPALEFAKLLESGELF